MLRISLDEALRVQCVTFKKQLNTVTDYIFCFKLLPRVEAYCTIIAGMIIIAKVVFSNKFKKSKTRHLDRFVKFFFILCTRTEHFQ